MSWLSKIWKGITGSQGLIGSAIGAISGSIQQKNMNDWNAEQAQINRDFQSEEAQKNRDFQSGEAELARIFNSNEAALQRDWSSQEAERARDWNEEMYEKYNSLSGKIAQAEQAGVNPMFAVTGNAVSPMATTAGSPSGASASGPSAGSVGTPSGATATAQFVDIVGQMLGLAKLKSEIDFTNAQTGNLNKQTSWIDTLNGMSLEESRQRISESVARIANLDADTDVKGLQLSEIVVGIANTEADTKVKEQQLGVMFAEMMKTYKSLDVMDAQIADILSHADVNRQQVANMVEEYNGLVQEHGHQAVMNAFTEVTASRDSGEENGYYRVISECKRFINSFLGWWSGTTSIDLPHKKPARIGFK